MSVRSRASRASVFALVGSALTLAVPVVAVSLPSSTAVARGQERALPDAQTAAPLSAADSQQFAAAAQLAWKQFNKLWVPKTGLALATPDYNKLTSWDIGSVLAGTYSARVLGLISEAEYHRRMSLTLRTVASLPLYRGMAYHRMYLSARAKMASRGGGLSTRGYGYSATDLGRLLIWLRIVADSDSEHTVLATRAARRLRMDSVVAGGYLHGEDVGASGKRNRFQEGRIGYEQYSATGFSLWGADVAAALDLHRNARPIEVGGVALLADVRGLDRIVSEPFFLLGLEYGWDPMYRALALEVLRAQERRATETGMLTFASEDAVGIPPFYFYYYCVYCTGKSFVVEVSEPGRTVTKPRWLSTKTAFAWHALLGTPYTRRGVEAAQAAASDARGWSSGILEGTTTPTYTYDINTAAVILEAAAYARIGRPLSKWKAVPASPTGE